MPAAQPRAGARRERLKFQQKVTTPDGGGGSSITWQDLGPEIWGSMEPLTGHLFTKELTQAEQVQARTSYKIMIYNRRDITAAMKIVWCSNGGKQLNIRDCGDPGQQARERMIIAEEAAPEEQ